MKTLLLSSLIALSTATALAQGTVIFANHLGGLDVPVYHSDGVTTLSGSRYIAELWRGTSQDNINALVASGGFLSGAEAGYFDRGLSEIIGTPPGGNAWLQVRFYDYAAGWTFAGAQASGLTDAWGESSPFLQTIGDDLNPALLTGLVGQSLMLSSIPEPSVLALLAGGMVLVLLKMGLTSRRSG